MRSNIGDRARSTFIERARREQILTCAAAAIAEVGFGQASLSEIARRAGVSKGVISYYFASKNELFEQVVADFYTRAGSSIDARVTECRGAAAVGAYIEANLSFVGEHPAQVRAVVEILRNLRRPDGALWFDAGEGDPVLAHLAGILQAGQDAAELGDFDAQSVAMIIRGAIDAAAGHLATDPRFDLDTYTRELVTLIERATRRST